MDMNITKRSCKKDQCYWDWRFFLSAREGFGKILSLSSMKGKTILMPAYIGYSTREGSGVMDPVKTADVPFEFYHLDAGLRIDTVHLKQLIVRHAGQILLLIHYFGFVDPQYTEIMAFARQNGMVIIEDFAHALFTFLKSDIREFDFAFFSIHKMLPFENGGMILSRKGIDAPSGSEDLKREFPLFDFDYEAIIRKRVMNYDTIKNFLDASDIKDRIMILRPELGQTVPQTFPILTADRIVRDRLYFGLNEQGFGAVSLYHTLIAEIGMEFKTERSISDRILNLPVHQDCSEEQLILMMQVLRKLIKEQV
ncbi:MAG: DegT/DnrJ/EryC1/StrS aminotransferase family protein [Candidatus Omnitrophica bacterium]|nr:DegT/DnrJ/EryC1/StrS aminotransferase family protein [Candidatus Omnitrophota bacterium]